MMAIGDVLSRLQGVYPVGQGKYKALCPAHDDRDPSLSVTEGDGGKVLIYCHAGCAYSDIVATMGLSQNGNGAKSAAATPANPKVKTQPARYIAAERRIVAAYDYHDATGQHAFQKVRYGPVKSFAIRRSDGRGGYTWGLGDAMPVLYRLPQLLDPATDWQPVYVCEGEKDADRLAGLGLVATCNFDGAAATGQRSKWRTEYNEHFSGRVVYILADNDDPGRVHAAAVASSLHGVAQAVKVVNLPGLPDKGDVSDWLDAGHTKEELERVCLMTPKWEPAADTSDVVNGNGPAASGPQSPNGASGQSAAVTPGPVTPGPVMSGPVTSGHLLDYRAEDGGILDLWHDLHGDEWLYATGFEEWHKWTGTHWQADTGGYGLKAEIANVIDAMNQTARRLRDAASDDKARERLTPYVNATKRTSARVASVEGLARLRRYVAADRLDAADVLNLANGTLYLAEGRLSTHDRADLLTYCLPYAHDPAAVAPNWHSFLSRIDPETVGFLQEFAGYALTPDCRHEIALWFYGPPGGGKSTFIGGLQAVLGPKVTVLGLADIERNRFALANLPGKTLAVATEQPGDYLASTHVLNALISGEPLQVERKYAHALTITPRAKLAWALNELPRVRGASDGIFRRVKIVEFPAIPEHERRPELKDAIQAEAAGILNWALAGLARLRARGRFIVPDAIEKASREYAAKNDIPAAFAEECCDVDPALSVQSSRLYTRYQNWCNETGHKPQSATSIAADWRRLGFVKRKTSGGMIWEGVGLKP